jgi:hypothetical protein
MPSIEQRLERHWLNLIPCSRKRVTAKPVRCAEEEEREEMREEERPGYVASSLSFLFRSSNIVMACALAARQNTNGEAITITMDSAPRRHPYRIKNAIKQAKQIKPPNRNKIHCTQGAPPKRYR